MRDFVDKVAVVTGAGSGIGRGMARVFAEAGMHVFVADIDADAAHKVAEEVGGTPAKVDVTCAAEVEALADLSFARREAVHILCNNAGIGIAGAVADMQSEDWRRIFSVNVDGVANGLAAFLPRMRKQRERGHDGHVVNTASALGLGPIPGRGLYCATKAAIVVVSEVLRTELESDGIGVTVLCPGSVRTAILEAERNQMIERGAVALDPVDRSGALDPDFVGREVLQAVRENRFYLVPLAQENRKLIPSIEARFSAIMAALN